MARQSLELGGARNAAGEAALAELQGDCLMHRLSPGGCADMLIIAIFFRLLLALDAGKGNAAVLRPPELSDIPSVMARII
jgi:hypothetical protein